MFCTMCGKEINDSSLFCKYCGSKVKKFNADVTIENSKEADIAFSVTERNGIENGVSDDNEAVGYNDSDEIVASNDIDETVASNDIDEIVASNDIDEIVASNDSDEIVASNDIDETVESNETTAFSENEQKDETLEEEIRIHLDEKEEYLSKSLEQQVETIVNEEEEISVPYEEVIMENNTLADDLAADVKNIVMETPLQGTHEASMHTAPVEGSSMSNNQMQGSAYDPSTQISPGQGLGVHNQGMQNTQTQGSQTYNQGMQNAQGSQASNYGAQYGQNQSGPSYGMNPNAASMAQNKTTKSQKQQAGGNELNQGKKSKKKFIIAGAIAVLLIGGSVTAYFVYQNFLDKQAEKVIALFEDENYEKSVALYEKYCEDKKDLKEDIEAAFGNRADEIKEDYFKESMEYEDAIELLEQIEEYDNDNLTQKVEETVEWIDKIESSREAYRVGKSLFDAQNYASAILQYEQVLEEDTEYATLASEGIKACEDAIAEEEKKVEEERLNTIKSNALSDSQSYMYNYDYESAIEVLKEALISWPEDDELTQRLKECEQFMAEGEKVIDITMETAKNTYEEGDIDILTYYFEYPVLGGESDAYEIINKIFETLNKENLNSCEVWADSLRGTSTDENFIANDYQNTSNVSYNQNGLLDIRVDGYAYYGGAHGEPIRTNFVFDLKSGQTLTLWDLITDGDSFNQKVVDAFNKLISSNPENYWEDAMDTVTAATSYENNFYLAEDGIHVYFYPYELASYAAGMVEVTIPYSGNEGLFTFLE